MQPTAVIARVLQRHGIRVDPPCTREPGSGVCRWTIGGRPENGRAWRFGAEVTVPDPQGLLWEFPIHTESCLLGDAGAQAPHAAEESDERTLGTPLPGRWRDFLRLRYPQKLDFCRMTFKEMRAAIENELRRRRTSPDAPAYFVAIGHSKDLLDFEAIDRFLDYLKTE